MRWIHIVPLIAAMVAAPVGARAQGIGLDEVVQAEILPGWQTERGTRMAGLKISLAPGWKTYWRAPGDAGIPPSFTWDGSRNMAQVTTHWPRPMVFDSGGYRTVGYDTQMVLPLEIAPERPDGAIALSGSVQIGICEDICIPVSLDLNAVLEGQGAPDADIETALAQRPTDGARAGVRRATCGLAPISDGVRLTAEIELPKLGRSETVVVEAGDPRLWVSEAKTDRRGKVLSVTADLVPPRGQPAAVDRSALRFTILGDRKAVDVRGCRAAG